jgi:hypothetical protein
MVVVASDTGGVGIAGANGPFRITVAMDHTGVDKVLPNDSIQREFSKMNLHPTTGSMNSLNHDAEFAAIATHYRFLQGHYPDLIIDVLSVHTKLGKRASFELARTVANELANRGVNNVLLDSDARLNRSFVSLSQDEEALQIKPELRAETSALVEALAWR